MIINVKSTNNFIYVIVFISYTETEKKVFVVCD